MLAELITLKKISYFEAQVYKMFAMDESGREWLTFMTHDTFMDCVPPPLFKPEIFAYTDGRRSIFRDIHATIDKVKNLLIKADQNV